MGATVTCLGVRITSAGAFFGESAIIESVKGKGTDFHRRIRTVRATMPTACVDEGILSFYPQILVYTENPYRDKK